MWDYGIMGKMSWFQTLVSLYLGILLSLSVCLTVKQAELTIMTGEQ